MIAIDTGNELGELLACAQQFGENGRLDVAVPFYDSESRLWTLLKTAAAAGTTIRLITRPASTEGQLFHFHELSTLGVRILSLPTIHAKTVLVAHRRSARVMGWIGSHNFTRASEQSAQELGVVFVGRGNLEHRLHTQALQQLDAWDHQARARRPLI